MISWLSSQMTMEMSYSSLVNPPRPPLHMLAPCTSVVVVNLDYSSHSTVYNMNMRFAGDESTHHQRIATPVASLLLCPVASPLLYIVLYRDCSALSAQRCLTLTTRRDSRNPTTQCASHLPFTQARQQLYAPIYADTIKHRALVLNPCCHPTGLASYVCMS